MTSIGKDGIKDEAAEIETLEPETWDSWFPKKFKELIDSIKDRDARKISRHLLDQKKLAEAHRAVHRGAETRRFLDSEFWKDFLKPELGGENSVKAWKPGDKRSLEEVAVDHLFNSGEVSRVEKLLNKFSEWIRVGDEAKKIIAADVERRDQVRDIQRAG